MIRLQNYTNISAAVNRCHRNRRIEISFLSDEYSSNPDFLPIIKQLNTNIKRVFPEGSAAKTAAIICSRFAPAANRADIA